MVYHVVGKNNLCRFITYANPYATEYDPNATPRFSTIQGVTNTFGASTYFAHETGVNKINLNGTEDAISSFVQSGDFDLPQDGDGTILLNIRRFLPDFKNLTGSVSITIGTKDFPIAGNTTTVSFVVNSTTSKIDTRVRGRLANIKIENSALNDNWRFGTFRADVQQDGRDNERRSIISRIQHKQSFTSNVPRLCNIQREVVMSQMPAQANDNIMVFRYY